MKKTVKEMERYNTSRNSLEIAGKKETVNVKFLKLRGIEYNVKLSKACDWCPKWRDNETRK